MSPVTSSVSSSVLSSVASSAPRILVVAATPRELAAGEGWHSVLCGVGPVEAAARTTRACADWPPDLVVHVGIAGARRQAGLAPGTIVVGQQSVYTDLGRVPAEWATRQLDAPLALLQAICAALPHAVAMPIGTSAHVGGTLAHDTSVPVEAMEGFAVLRAAQLAGVAAIEVRAISNDIEEADRSRWHFDTAFQAITDVTPTLVRAVRETWCPEAPHA